MSAGFRVLLLWSCAGLSPQEVAPDLQSYYPTWNCFDRHPTRKPIPKENRTNLEGADGPMPARVMTFDRLIELPSAVYTDISIILMREVLGINAEPSSWYMGTSQYSFDLMAGCEQLDDHGAPIEYDPHVAHVSNKPCTVSNPAAPDYDGRRGLFFIGSWKSYAEPGMARMEALGYNMEQRWVGAYGRAGLFVKNKAIDSARADMLDLTWISNYALPHYPANTYFGGHTYMNVTGYTPIPCTTWNVLQPDSAEFQTYAELSGDVAGGPDSCVGSSKEWWLSPACRAAPERCVPVVTSGGATAWDADKFMQYSHFYTLPIAITTLGYADWQREGDAEYGLMYWWYPDMQFQNSRPKAMQGPVADAFEQGQGIWRTMNTADPLMVNKWSGVAKLHRRLNSFIDQISFSDADISEMFDFVMRSGLQEELDKGTAEGVKAAMELRYETACQLILQNFDKKYSAWIPPPPCPEGFERVSGECMPCQAGFYCTAGLSVKCEPGNYCPVGSNTQLPCQEGTANGEEGGTSLAACVPCASGTYMGKEGRSQCQDCPVGFYAETTGQSACAACLEGTYQAEEGMSACTSCSETFTTALRGSSTPADCGCPEGTFWNREQGVCDACQDKAVCRGGLGVPVILEGFYARYVGNVHAEDLAAQEELQRAASYPEGGIAGAFSRLALWECSSFQRCPGDEQTAVPTVHGVQRAEELDLAFQVRTPEVCPEGTHNIACAECEADKWGSMCTNECSGATGITGVVLLLVLLPVFMAVGYYATSTPYSATPNAAFQLAGTMGIVMFFLQSVAVMRSFDVPWPIELDIDVSIFLFDLGGTSVGCVFGQNFVAQFWLPILLPPLFILAMVVAYGLSQIVPDIKGKVMAMEVSPSINFMGMLTSALYITLCKVVVSFFECEPNPYPSNGTLAKFKQIECDSDEKYRATGAMVIGLLLYVVAFFGVTAWINYIAPMKFPEKWFRQRCKFLVNRWRPDVWWFGQVVMARNLAVSLVAALFSDPSDQTIFLVAIMLLFLAVNAMMLPWKDPQLCYFDNGICLLVIVCAFVVHAILHFDAINKQAKLAGNVHEMNAALSKTSTYAKALQGLAGLFGLWVIGVIVYCVHMSLPKSIAKKAESEKNYIEFMVDDLTDAFENKYFRAALLQSIQASTYYDRVAIEAFLRSIQRHLPVGSGSSPGSKPKTTGRLVGRLYDQGPLRRSRNSNNLLQGVVASEVEAEFGTMVAKGGATVLVEGEDLEDVIL